MSIVVKKEKLKAERASAAHEALLTDIIANLPDAILAFDAAGEILFSNHAAQAWLGLGPKALMAAPLARQIGEAHPLLQEVRKVIASGKTLTLYGHSVQGRDVHSATISPAGDGLYMLSLHFEAANMKTAWADKARDALKPAQLMARTLAHEIKNPLAGIRAAAQLLARLEFGADDRELVDLIAAQTDRIGRLVGKVDIFADVPPAQYINVNIHEVLGQVVRLTRAACGEAVTIVEKYDPSLPDLRGHADHLVQAVLNMLNNAVESGAAQVTLRSFYDTAAAYHPARHQKLPLCIEVEDNGSGMDAETCKRLFEPYYTTKPKGEGLGLAIVSKIIDDHGGAIDVTSVAGKTVFRLSFPMPKGGTA